MEWLWFDSDRDEPTRWWTIDPQTGQPDGQNATDPAGSHCLGESVLDDVSMVADAIATTFATKGFSDEELVAVLSERAVPGAFRGPPDDAANLVESVDDLWALAETCYQRALGRRPDRIERQWLQDFALAALRARGGREPIA
jgi:hypothetical protein